MDKCNGLVSLIAQPTGSGLAKSTIKQFCALFLYKKHMPFTPLPDKLFTGLYLLFNFYLFFQNYFNKY